MPLSVAVGDWAAIRAGEFKSRRARARRVFILDFASGVSN